MKHSVVHAVVVVEVHSKWSKLKLRCNKVAVITSNALCYKRQATKIDIKACELRKSACYFH